MIESLLRRPKLSYLLPSNLGISIFPFRGSEIGLLSRWKGKQRPALQPSAVSLFLCLLTRQELEPGSYPFERSSNSGGSYTVIREVEAPS